MEPYGRTGLYFIHQPMGQDFANIIYNELDDGLYRMSLANFAGFGVHGYKSFGGEKIQFVGPMSRIHLVVGQNNVGKSNALKFMHDSMSELRNGLGQPYVNFFPDSEIDIPEGWDTDLPKRLSIGLNWTDEVSNQLRLDSAARSLIPVLKTEAFSHGDKDVIWFDFEVRHDDTGNLALKPRTSQITDGIVEAGSTWMGSLSSVSTTIAQQSGGDDYNYESIMSRWTPWIFIPAVHWVDAVREIKKVTNNSVGSSRRNGSGLIEELASLQSPGLASRASFTENTAKFNALQDFVRNVLDDNDARVQIPDSKDTIIVHTHDGTVRQLEALGTGISEVIMLAAAATGIKDSLVCIEEPELHLHPTLQRKLIEYLNSHTENHYLISTHSASLLNSELTSISHVRMEGKWSIVDKVISPTRLAEAVFDLGNRASDIVQSNFIIWVEGPSDRLYVAHWLSLADSSLIEGAHFSIMFYGGGLLNHLSADDSETDELINLLRINRHFAIIIDSDKRSIDDDLNQTKQRVIAEMERIDGQVWVTTGYTIENYVPSKYLKEALLSEYPDKQYSIPAGQFKSPLGGNFPGVKTRPSKVMVARHVIAGGHDWAEWPEDMRTAVTELARRIRAANGLPNLDTPSD